MTRRIPFLLVLALGILWNAGALGHFMERRGPLAGLLGATLPLVFAGLGVAMVASAVAFAREVRAARKRPFAAWRALFVAGVVAWLGFLLLVHPAERLWIEAGVGLGLGLFAILLILEGAFARFPGRLRRGVDVVVFSLCASALGLELCLRAVAAVHPTQLLARVADLPEDVVERMRRSPGELYLGYPCNSAGHYDDEFRPRRGGERLVATIGDSFSLGIVPHGYHFTTVCERRLGIPVANLGISSTGPAEYLRMLVDEALPLDPDVVVIDLFVGNDLVPYDRPPRPALELARAWLDRERVLLWLVPRRLAKLAEERRLAGRDGPVGEAPGAEAPRVAAQTPEVLLAALPWLADPMLEEPSFSEENFRRCEASRARPVCGVRPDELETLHRALLSMQHAAGAERMCVMLIPDEFQVEDAVWADVLATIGEPDLDRDHAQDVLRPWLGEHGIPVLDLLPRLRAVPPMADGRRHLYHLRDTHFNARGNAVAGEALAEFLEKRLAELPPR